MMRIVAIVALLSLLAIVLFAIVKSNNLTTVLAPRVYLGPWGSFIFFSVLIAVIVSLVLFAGPAPQGYRKPPMSGPPGSTYEPAHLEGGKVVPGVFK